MRTGDILSGLTIWAFKNFLLRLQTGLAHRELLTTIKLPRLHKPIQYIRYQELYVQIWDFFGRFRTVSDICRDKKTAKLTFCLTVV